MICNNDYESDLFKNINSNKLGENALFEYGNSKIDDGHVISNTADSNGVTKKSLRAKLSNKM